MQLLVSLLCSSCTDRLFFTPQPLGSLSGLCITVTSHSSGGFHARVFLHYGHIMQYFLEWRLQTKTSLGPQPKYWGDLVNVLHVFNRYKAEHRLTERGCLKPEELQCLKSWAEAQMPAIRPAQGFTTQGHNQCHPPAGEIKNQDHCDRSRFRLRHSLSQRIMRCSFRGQRWTE